MIEVEAKVRIARPEKYRNMAKKLGKFKGREKKVDDYYSLQKEGYRKKSLRVRHRKGFYEVNFKQRVSYNSGIHAKNEREFKVSDIDNFLSLIKDFGFEKWLRKEKETELYEIKKGFHIEINRVDKLGWFMEVEYLCGEKEIAKARKEILILLKKLGVRKNEIVKDGYTKMLWDLKRKKI